MIKSSWVSMKGGKNDSMITLYWSLQYAAVLCGYLFLMFVWPKVVFHKYLAQKGKRYQFSFCVTVQILLINTVILGFGLLHILNRWTVMAFFCGIFLLVLLRRANLGMEKVEEVRYLVTGVYGRKRAVLKGLFHLGSGIKKQTARLWAGLYPRLGEYAVLSALLIFGMIYFSYGSFQHYSYGFGDMYVHHSWIYGLMEGKVFSDGVYPEAMHCFIYSLYAILGIEVYSSLLFVAGIHVTVLLLSLYCLLREIFHWPYAPFFVLMLFLTLDASCVDEVFGMSRLQWTIPQEFGLYTQFLCALYLIRFLKNSKYQVYRRKGVVFYWDENLFLFTMALAASVAIHFYVTMMAFFLCASFALFALRKVFCRKRIKSLMAAVLCGVMIAALPMAGGLVSGIPFQGSIGWAVNVMNGTDTGEGRTHLAEDDTGTVEKIKGIYWQGYHTLYGAERAKWIIALTGAAAALWLVYRLICALLARRWRIPVNKSRFDGYPGMIFASFLFMLIYAAPFIGLPELIAGARLCSTEQMLILAVMVMPLDMLFSLLAIRCPAVLLRSASVICTAGIYAAAIFLGVYHGYLYNELTRYNSVVMTTNSIIRELPQNTYTVVSPTDELYPLIRHGWHEELSSFVEKSQGMNYTLPTEKVFLYIEKRPIRYAQFHFPKGPWWLGAEKYPQFYSPQVSSQCPNIHASEISAEAAGRELEADNGWHLYTNADNRMILESKAYQWCQHFSEIYPFELNIYYEDEDFVCYYFEQEPNSPYDLAIK